MTIPQFNKVNDRYYNGTVCPVATQHHVLCPTLCVKDQQQCPTPCPKTQLMCSDGSCQSSCTKMQDDNNKCGYCSSNSNVALKQCRSTPLYVDIQNYKPDNATLQLYETCSNALETSVYQTWDDVQQINMIWNVCNAPKGMTFPINVDIVVIFLSVYLAFFPLWGLWAIFKYTKERNFHTHQIALKGNDSCDSPPLKETIIYTEEKEETKLEHVSPRIEQCEQTQDIELNQKGFKSNILGSFMIVYMAIISVFWMIILLVVCLDYYGHIRQSSLGLFYNSYDLSSKAFCLAWFLATSWYLTINITRTKIRNHFRIRTSFKKSNYIQITKPRKVIQMLNNDQSDSNSLKKLEATIRKAWGFDVLVKTVPVVKNSKSHRYFEFQSTRYNLKQNVFQPATVEMSMKPNDLLNSSHGLDSRTAASRLETLGPNFIEVKVPSFLKAFWEELTGFFYIYQIMILWCYYYLAYWQIGLSDTLVILLAALIKVIVRLKSERRVKKMAEHVDTCNVLRQAEWRQLSTADLVPGDVFHIEPNQIVPVDAVILQGDIVVDESSLTGEPLPIRKFPLRLDNMLFDTQSAGKVNSLFAGTTIKQAVTDSSTDRPIALVLKTRTDTDKGQLVQRILFPQPVSFIFNEQLKLVFCLLLIWALVLLGFGSWWLGGNGMTAWFYGTVCAAQVMNPLLPAILVVGQSIAAGRLKKKGVYCVDLPRILMAGKVQVFCFDKTGTLTNEGLEYYGVHPVTKKNHLDNLYHQFNDLSPQSDQTHRLLQMGLSSCHSVTTLNGEYVGNPVDIVMFTSTNASMATESGLDKIFTSNGDLLVIQRFEFQHARASMSIAVKDTTTGHTHVFCKGSFERIAQVCENNIPDNFDRVTSQSAKSGCYVLGIAHRDLGVLTEQQEYQLHLNCTRDQLEQGLDFLGLVLFKNLLKPDTAESVQHIKQGDVRVVMITGDNCLTGVFIGQQCGLVPENSSIILGDVLDQTIVWTDIETGVEVKDIDKTIECSQGECELAVTGNAFRWLLEHNKMRDYLFVTRIFARMTPVDKMVCVELMMEKAIVAMCGDGGNDCGALRSAHVGIAMSEAEASVVSPFSTPNRSVRSCVDLLIQGRAALATSFASYKYLIMYGEIMATSKLCTFYYTMSFSQWNFILIDAFITVFCAFGVTQAGAAKRLSHHRPTARILGPEVLLSVLGQIWINAWFLIGAFIWLYSKDDFFRCNEWDARATDNAKWWLLGDSFEADIVTFVVLFQFVNAALVFNYGYIFRERWYYNYFLMVVCATFIGLVSYWELADPNRFGCLMRINCGNADVLESLGYPRPDFYIEPYNNPLGHNVLPKYFRYQLWVFSIVNMCMVHIWERVFVLGPIRQWFRQKYPLQRLAIKL
ncbi:hypothetical protein MFLAVUS_010292 [Mucor flavus]|uniref:Cation-transporting P-type ATPase N-terminal domain-containing protein n=1 Tax=Mucor flavus TaxID=439312 RepID=A0ABP9ZCB4_9FUNG